MSLRYKSEGEVHKDFHRLFCATLHYLEDNYGGEAVDEIMRKTAQDVYRTIHEAVKAGDCAELCEYWKYYLEREGGVSDVEYMSDGVKLTVHECPAQKRLAELGEKPDSMMCRATEIFDKALADGSPFNVSLKRTGDFSCIQCFRRGGAQ